MIRPMLVLSACVIGAGCGGESERPKRPETSPSKAATRHAEIKIDECVDAEELDAAVSNLSAREYAPTSIGPSGFVGVTPGGDCIVLSAFDPPSPNDCSVDVRVRLQETDETVTITRYRRGRLTPPEVGACPLDDHRNLVAIALRAPLGNREIIDSSVGASSGKDQSHTDPPEG